MQLELFVCQALPRLPGRAGRTTLAAMFSGLARRPSSGLAGVPAAPRRGALPPAPRMSSPSIPAWPNAQLPPRAGRTGASGRLLLLRRCPVQAQRLSARPQLPGLTASGWLKRMQAGECTCAEAAAAMNTLSGTLSPHELLLHCPACAFPHTTTTFPAMRGLCSSAVPFRGFLSEHGGTSLQTLQQPQLQLLLNPVLHLLQRCSAFSCQHRASSHHSIRIF
jgi:hypothetical protein